MAKPTVALSQLSFEQVMLTQKLPGIVPPWELAIRHFAHASMRLERFLYSLNPNSLP
jgi:hypothetical protein